jgi:flagellar capping protein FliD
MKTANSETTETSSGLDNSHMKSTITSSYRTKPTKVHLQEQQYKCQTRLSQRIEAKPSDFEALTTQAPSAPSLSLGVLD